MLALERGLDSFALLQEGRFLLVCQRGNKLGQLLPDARQRTGFAFYDEGGQTDGLESFLSSREPPIVFTQGSTAVAHPGSFFETSEQAALRLGKRALLLGARETGARSDQVFRTAYAPYAQVSPRAAAIVHQGGSGTTGQAFRAGKPMRVVPFGWDQPDNALRVKRLGAGLAMARHEYRVDIAAAALDRLLREPQFAGRASEIAEQVRAQDEIGQACDAIEGAMIGR